MNRPGQVFRNVCLAGGTAVEHFGDDPVVLALQISRRVPSRMIDPLLRVVRCLPGNGTVATLGALLEGDRLQVADYLQHCSQHSTSEGQRRRMAEIAIAAGMPETAAELLSGSRETQTRGRGTEARLRWYNGDMTGAVQVLEGGSYRQRVQKQRLLSETEVFGPWKPKLSRIMGYAPQDRTVLHILTNSLPHTQSGYAQRSHSLLKAQLDLGWNVHAVTRLGYPVQVGKPGARDTDVMDGVIYHRVLPGKMPFGLKRRLQRQAEETLALALALKPAVLHTTTHFTNGLVAEAVAEALGIPWVYEVRGQLADTWASNRSETAKTSERYRKFRARETAVASSASAVATLGAGMLEVIVADGTPAERTVLLPNAVGGEFLHNPVSAAEARLQVGIDAEFTVIGTVSSLVDYEGLDDLLRAFGILSPQHPLLRCLIVGSGAAEPALKHLAAELGISDRVTFTGRIPRSRAHLYHQALDVFVVPRKDLAVTRSVTPLKPVEALASGRPVVFSSLPALHELVRDGVDGLSAPADNPKELAMVLDELIKDPSRRSAMGSAGRAHILATRTWQAIGKDTIDVYERLKAGV